MIAIIGSIVGFICSSIPEIMRFFQDKEDKKHELAILQMQIEQQKTGHIQKLQEIESKADIIESKALYQHAAKPSGSPWIEALRGSVRPVITYGFFSLFAIVKMGELYLFLQEGKDVLKSLVELWDSDTEALFAAIISFWFGQRAVTKFRKGE